MNLFSIEPLKNAIARLKEGIQIYQENPSIEIIRDGLIQRFEFTYEISHKILKRFLEIFSPSEAEYDEMSFQNLIRSGNEKGLLLGNWENWKKYREMRSKTSHTYDEIIAIEVINKIPDFLTEAEYLLTQLERRSNPNISLSEKELNIVQTILKRFVPEYEVLAFGSRVQKKDKAYSDLDLVIMSTEPLPIAVHANLTEAFDESDLVFKVDIVDWASISPEFQKIIHQKYFLIQSA